MINSGSVWHAKRKRFRTLGMESRMWTEGCVFFDGRGIQSRIATHGPILKLEMR